ncbi:hypothetical protein ACFFS2_22155, partial [Streptomyces aurantiacus]|uniref:hypothetical protein n=1 Tax=Streptomyces aurantiacus TaxID=47760 RepID=UPI0035E5B23E
CFFSAACFRGGVGCYCCAFAAAFCDGFWSSASFCGCLCCDLPVCCRCFFSAASFCGGVGCYCCAFAAAFCDRFRPPTSFCGCLCSDLPMRRRYFFSAACFRGGVGCYCCAFAASFCDGFRPSAPLRGRVCRDRRHPTTLFLLLPVGLRPRSSPAQVGGGGIGPAAAGRQALCLRGVHLTLISR